MKTFEQFVNEAYVNNEKTKQVREDLKKEFPDFRFSVRKRHYSTVDVSILSGPLDLINGTVNIYWIKDHYKDEPEIRDFLQKVVDIINKGNFDKSDAMTDYFHVGFYVDLAIGDVNRPYVKTASKSKKREVPKDEVHPRISDLHDEERVKNPLRSFERKNN